MNPADRHHERWERLRRLAGQLRAGRPADDPLLPFVDELEALSGGLVEDTRALIDRLEALEFQQRVAAARISAVEQSRLMRLARVVGGPLLDVKARAGQLLLRSRFHKLYAALRPPRPDSLYARWLEEREANRASCRQSGGFAYAPVVSVVVPVHRPERRWLQEAIDSVAAQTYATWELCLCDDASDAWVFEYLNGRAREDSRIRVVRSPDRLGISGATNLAVTLAAGDYLAFMDQDDVLASHALESVVESLQESRADLLYSDESILDSDGAHMAPVFKPAWSPDLLLSCMYLCHLLVVSHAALRAAGGFRSEYDGAQDYDLALRLTDGGASVRHIPDILYGWRMHYGSTAGAGTAKPYTHVAGRRAVEDAIRRRGWSAEVADGPAANVYDVRWRVSGDPLTSIVVCSRNVELLRQCLESIDRGTTRGRREIVVVYHVRNGEHPAAASLFAKHNVRVVRFEGAFNFSRMNNLGAAAAQGEVLVFLNDDIEPISPHWLDRLVAQCERPDVGVVGAKLLYPSGALQHGGMVIGIHDGCGHAGRGAVVTPYWRWNNFTRDVSAVTGACLAIRKQVFDRLGGFDESFPVNYNDADLCLRARKERYRVILDAQVVLRHYESRTRAGGVAASERARWSSRWSSEMRNGDPFYSPNLTRLGEHASLRFLDEG